MVPEDLYDWEKCHARLAAQAPWWEPGTASGYHAITQGYLVGEVVRRVTRPHRSAPSSPRSWPARWAPTSTSAPARSTTTAWRWSSRPRASRSWPASSPGSIPARVFTATRRGRTPRVAWTEGWRRCESPAANGHGNARSVGARAVGPVPRRRGRRHPPPVARRLRGRIRGAGQGRRTSCSACRSASAWATASTPPSCPSRPNPRACFWGGWGGSIVINDLDARLTVAYVMNRMGEGTTGDDRGIGIALATFMAVMG